MNARSIEIWNVMGIEHSAFNPGALTVIEGRNASGKTSTLEAIRAVLRGGHDPSLIRHGADVGQVKITLEDGTTITKTIRQDGSQLDVHHPQFGKVSKAQSVVDGMVDSLGIDPLALLAAPAKARAQYLLDVIPVEVDVRELEAAAGDALTMGTAFGREKGTAFDHIAACRKAVFDDRTGVNRSLKDKRASVKELRETIPPASTERPDVDGIRKRIEAVEQDIDFQVEQANEKLKSVADNHRTAAEGAIILIRGEAEKEIEAIRNRMTFRIDHVKAERDQLIDMARESRDEAIGQIHRDLDPKLAALRTEAGVAEEQDRQAAQNRKTAEIAAKMESEAAKLEEQSTKLTAAIDNLDALRDRLMADLPIKGLEVRDGDIYLDGIPFNRLNRARQVKLALEVGRLRAGKLGIMVVDNLECFDAKTSAAFEEQARDMGLQVIVGRVSEGDLSVRSADAPVAAE